MELKGKTALFLGDSITEGHGTSGQDHTFWALLGQRTGATCIGYGIGGTRIAPQPDPSPDEAWNRYFNSRVEEMAPAADLVMVFGGTNDYGHGEAPFGQPEDREETSFIGACRVLFTHLIEKYPDAVIVIATPTRREEDGPHLHGKVEKRPLADYVQAIRDVAAEYSLPVMDFWNVSGIQPKIPAQKERFMPDGLHPNDAGHERLCDRLQAFLESL